ncbi:MAG: CPBP family intramembrane glutamic endopeptidase [Gemmatimonadota bacterium]
MEPTTRSTISGILAFLALTAALAAVFATLILHSGHLATGRWLFVQAGMWCPGIAALVVSRLRRRPLSEIGWHWPWRFQIAAWALPIGFSIAVYSLAWSIGVIGFPNHRTVASIATDFGWTGAPVPIVVGAFGMLTVTVGLAPALASALGEEIGWRGYLVPELARITSFRATALISGCVWALWHLPIILFADFHGEGARWVDVLSFTTFVMSAAVLCAWIRVASGSVWPAAMLHATQNIAVQDVLDPLAVMSPHSHFFVGDFGILPSLGALAAAVVVWRRSAYASVPLRLAQLEARDFEVLVEGKGAAHALTAHEFETHRIHE